MDKLINTNGQINFHGYDLRNNMDNPITGLRKKMGVNQFQFIGFTGDDLILGFAIVSLKWISNQPNNGQCHLTVVKTTFPYLQAKDCVD
jgi:hypothetical protein